MLSFITRLITLLALATSSWAASVTARLERASAIVGDTVMLEIRVSDGRLQNVPAIGQQPNLSIQFAGQRNEYINVNGQASSALVLSYIVSPSAPGTYTIPAVRVPVEGSTYQTQPLTLTVTKDDSSGGIRAAFIQIVPSKTNVYVGEMFPIEIKVYGLIIDQLQVPVLKSDGFTIGTQAQGSRSREQVGNAIYNVYTFPTTVSAAKAGNLTLGPAETPALIRVPLQNNRRRTPDLIDELFGGSQRKDVVLTSDPIPIHVNSLPAENVPPSFNGAIGNFQLSVKTSATNVAVGDPITLDIKIQGRGAFDSLKLPDLNWKDFTFYQPNSAVTNRDALGLQALKSFDQVIVPQRAGLTMIPPLIFSFFDPDQRVYKTLQGPTFPITVRATGQGQAQPTVVADQTSPAIQQQSRASDIVHIKPTLGQLTVIGAPLPLRPSFVILQLIPVGLWLGATIWRKRADQLASDPRLRRRREVARIIAEGLPLLRQAAARNESQQFFATGFRLLQEQIGERLNLPAAAITEAVLDEKLPNHGASPELLARLRELFQACNQARYAGVTTAGMEALIPKFEAALGDLQKLPSDTLKVPLKYP